MYSADRLGDPNVDELRSCFLKGLISHEIEQKLLHSRRLRQALLGTPISNQKRYVLVNGEMSNRLRSELIGEMNKLSIRESTPIPDDDHKSYILKSSGNSTQPMDSTISNVLPTLTMSTGAVQRSQEKPSTVSLGQIQGVSCSRNITPPARAVGDSEVSIANGYPTPFDQTSPIIPPSSDLTYQAAHQLTSSWGQLTQFGYPLDVGLPEKDLEREHEMPPSSGRGRTDSVGSNTQLSGTSHDYYSRIAGGHAVAEVFQSFGSPRISTNETTGDRHGDLSDVEARDADLTFQFSRDLSGETNADEFAERKGRQVSSDTAIDWSYNTWTDSSGKILSTMAALLPQGYTLHDDPQAPWICPIRSCRALFCTLGGLKSHFCSVHKASLLNDNEDGTLSVVKKMETRIPPLVVSRKPLDLRESSMVEPSLTETTRLRVSKCIPSASSEADLTPDRAPKAIHTTAHATLIYCGSSFGRDRHGAVEVYPAQTSAYITISNTETWS
ncbi:hypothetical protein F4818DRAFT_85307 [Hypoxylon cercidicola]|nr:hypothetical protein F4818DRAFT_85307 [Hypoxylon cercidicola]